jgi:hypothetical protein
MKYIASLGECEEDARDASFEGSWSTCFPSERISMEKITRKSAKIKERIATSLVFMATCQIESNKKENEPLMSPITPSH